MPASKYKGAQRRAYYATDGWKRPVKKAAKGKAKSKGRKKR